MLSLLELSFYLAYFFLTGTSALTAFEVFSYYPEKYQVLKYILVIETAVNVIASIAYNNLLNLINNKPINYGNITTFRYLDWICTTPLLLISFTLYLQYKKTKDTQNNINKSSIEIDYYKLGIIIGLNIIMLIFGFLGETGKINHILGCIIGFIPFFLMFYLIWKWYGKYNKNSNIFIVFLIIWSLYGIVYFLPNTSKNINYNILDIIAKVGFGLLIWAEILNLRFNNELPSNELPYNKLPSNELPSNELPYNK